MTIEIGPSACSAARPAAAVDTRAARAEAAPSGAQPQVAQAAVSDAAAALDAGTPPVDSDRVAMIRKAIEDGHYPVVPTRVADAVIAAGLLLRTGK